MRILVIEDEHRIAAAIKKGLEQERYSVDAVYDGEEGYDMAVAEEYDLIVLDLMLPKIDGITLCRKLRDENVHTPVLMLTARGQVAEKVEGLNAGADDYLVKPFAFAELVARVRALSRRPSEYTDSVVKVEDISLDTIHFTVERSGKPITLTRKEFTLLEYLVRNAEHVVTKNSIISHVWNYDADVLDNTVEVYIRTLRRKLGSPDIIQTVRGFGYKLSGHKK